MGSRIKRLAAKPTDNDEFQLLGTLTLNKGMMTVFDPTDIPDEAVLVAKNARIRYDSIERSPGSSLIEDLASGKVLGIFQHVSNVGTSYVYAADSGNLYRLTFPGAVALAGTLSGSDSDRFRFVSFLNRLFFSNNGFQVIQEVDPLLDSFGDLGNAAAFKYLTAFGNRLVGFNRTAPTADPTYLGWSGNGVPDEWDPLIDVSAGGTPLGTSPGDRSDEGTGIFGFTSVAIIIRLRSIWRVFLQPVASRPFNPIPFIPGVGSDAPDSIVVIPNGIIFADTRTQGVYKLDINEGIQNIGRVVENEIFRGVTSPEEVFAAYDDHNKEYQIGVKVAATNEVKIWVYNLITGAWSFDSNTSISSIASIEPGGTGFPWDSAIGTWDNAIGTWDEAVGTLISKNTLFFGSQAGEITQLDETINNLSDTVVETKDFQFPDSFIHTARLTVWLSVQAPSVIKVFASTNSGSTWKLVKTKTYGTSSERTELRVRRHIRAKIIRFRIEVSSGKVTFREIFLNAIPSEGDFPA